MDRHGSGKLTIRRMTAEDIGQVVKVEIACFSEPWSEEVFHATLLLPYAYYYVAEITADDGKSFLLPAIKQCILDIDVEAGTMKIHILEGLLDL